MFVVTREKRNVHIIALPCIELLQLNYTLSEGRTVSPISSGIRFLIGESRDYISRDIFQ